MRLIAPIAFALLAALATPLAAQSVEPDVVTSKYGERRAYFKDWLAACRPGGYCSALAYVGTDPDGELSNYVLRVEQTADGADYGVIYIPVAVIPNSDPTLSIVIDGNEIAELTPGDDQGLTREPDDAMNEYRFAQSRSNLEIVPAMKRGRFMAIAFQDDNRSLNAQTFSLRGLTAALAWFERGRMK